MTDIDDGDTLDRIFCRHVYHELASALFPPERLRYPKIGSRFYAEKLYRLQCFVDDLNSTHEVPFVLGIDVQNKTEYKFAHLVQRHFRAMQDFIDTIKSLSPMYDYNEHINVFTRCCDALGLLDATVDWSDFWRSPPIVYPQLGGMNAAELFNRLVSDIREMCRSNNVKAKIRHQRAEANKRHAEYLVYDQELFDNYAILIVSRVDLYYQKEFANSIDIHDAVNDLDHLIQNFRCNAIFRHLVGRIIKLEYGADGKGIHFHLILYFDGSKRKKTSHIYLTQCIGEYWVKTITKGRGDYWNCNAHIQDFIRRGTCGIGPIHANDMRLRSNLRNIVIKYLCKSDQFVRPKFGAKIKLIRRGGSPKKRPVKRGRPRLVRTFDSSSLVGVGEHTTGVCLETSIPPGQSTGRQVTQCAELLQRGGEMTDLG